MGVKGLQQFVEQFSPGGCIPVDLRVMAQQHGSTASSMVDGMACLRHWYSCEDWVCGGQWKEYISLLARWVEAFTVAGIKLVFFLDGVVDEQKRPEWARRRRRVTGEIAKVFRHLKAKGEQPHRGLLCLPSGLATFTRFALRSLGQEVFCSVREADYEIASYARRHGSMGILGQDSDFLIFNSAPYLSVVKLHLDTLTTVVYKQDSLCQTLSLAVYQLPLLACILGNDIVSEERMQRIRGEDEPSLESLWFGGGPTVSDPRLARFLSIFDCQEFSPLYGTLEDDSLPAALCLVTHLALQVQQLSLEDIDAYLSQAVCVRHRSHQELQRVKLPRLSSRAVQMASLYVRGLAHLLGANCACGGPLPNDALMPWQSFDGRLFHSKYLLAHSGATPSEMLDDQNSSLDLFVRLRERALEACRKRGRTVRSRPRPATGLEPHRSRNAPPGYPPGHPDGWMESGEQAYQPGGRWRDEGKMERSAPDGYHRREGSEGGGGGGGGGGGHRSSPTQQAHPLWYPHPGDGGLSHPWPSRRSLRGRPGRPNRRGFRLAPRWSQPSAPWP